MKENSLIFVIIMSLSSTCISTLATNSQNQNDL